MKTCMIKYLKWIFLVGCLLTPSAFAICPLCTIAVGAGIGFFEWLGISDLITGLWIGALIVSLSSWTGSWLNRKGWKFVGAGLILFLIYSIIIVLPLYYPLGYIGRPNHSIWHIDILLLGIITGAVVFFCASITHAYLRIQNHGKVYFPLQKVIIPILPLVLLSILFYFNA